MEPSLTQVRADAFLAEAFALCHLTLSESEQFNQTKQISTHANNRALVRAGEQAMLRITLALFILTVLPSSMRGEPACEDSYASCMASCATDRSAERCMQGCMARRNQCVIINLPKRAAEQEALAEAVRKERQRPRSKELVR